jgi:YegS/Rv2252/BmrU family lipid kinase
MTDTWLAIVNPAAGGGRCGKQYREALDRLRSGGLEIDVVETEREGQATELAADAWRNGRRRYLAVGGDGTSYEVVNGLFPAAADAGERPRLAFLPMGTGNSFLRDFSDKGAEHSLAALAEGRARACDVMRLRHRTGTLHWINICSIGFVADVNGLRARRFKSWGELGYVAAVVTSVVGLKPRAFPLRIDDEARDDTPLTFASFNNSKFTGGKMMMAPEADTADGLVDAILVGEMGRFDLLRTFPKIFEGTHVKHRAVRTAKAKSIRFEGDDEIDVMIDGEAIRVIPAEIDVLPGALDVVV